MTINRRKFFSNTTMSAAGLLLGANICDDGLTDHPVASSYNYNIMKEVMKYRKIDCHTHIWLSDESSPELQLDFADRLGIEKLVISRPITEQDAPHQAFVDSNNMIIKAKKQHPDRFIGQFTLNPKYTKESLEEINRCVDKGMVGLKVYYQTKINDPLFYPIIEKMIDLKMIILMHSYSGIGRGGYRTKYGNLYPKESTPEDFVDVAKRYPEALLQFAHLGGGGDWEYECKALKDYPNIYVDVGGSNNEADVVNYAIEYLGEDRVFFASDNSYYQSVSKILAVDLTDNQRKKIFFENYNRILCKGGYNVA
ncbi:MAG: amidohydrolase [Bacteroidales bacterium]|nr:amidohydrolase [Bacteroidales bacterium]